MHSDSMHLLLVGNYGAGNLGDELLREYFLRTFPEIRWSVVSASPRRSEELPRLPLGVRSFFSFSWGATMRAIIRCDGVVLGGGSLFTDIESVAACLLWYLHAKAAVILRRPVFLAFQGIGPFRTRVGEWCARDILRSVSFASVRDEASYARVGRYKLNKEVIQTSDPVLSLFTANDPTIRQKKILVIIPRKNSSSKLQSRSQELTGSHSFEEIRILSLEPGSAGEQRVCSDLRHALPGYVRVMPVASAADLAAVMRDSSLVLSERYHGSLAAICMGIPCESISQGEGDKMASLPRPGDLPIQRERLQEGEAALRAHIDLMRK